jgi:hypothetical protein
VQGGGLAFGGIAVLVQRVADRVQHLVVLAPHLLGQERSWRLRAMRGDALGLADVRQQVSGIGSLRQLRRAQRHQLLAQRQHVQRR